MGELGIIFGSFIAIIATILHYVTKWKELKTMSAEGEASMGDLRGEAERLEVRLRSLERILDAEIPDWRSRYADE